MLLRGNAVKQQLARFVACRYGFLLVADEAHALLCLGPTGGGVAEAQGIVEKVRPSIRPCNVWQLPWQSWWQLLRKASQPTQACASLMIASARLAGLLPSEKVA